MMNRSEVSYEEFEHEYLSTGRLWSGAVFKVPRRILNKKQLQTAYQTHLRKIKRMWKKWEQKKNREESHDQKLRNECLERDKGWCQVVSLFTCEEMERFKKAANGMERTLDAAHIFGKNAYPHMRHVKENIVILNRASHGWLDTGKSPVDGKPITNEEKIKWWKRIVGTARYELLEDLSRKSGE